MNLRSLDLNLLVVFDAVFKERNITKAGAKIGLSQSSVSNALTRLRGHLNDELFLRGSGTMRPTPRAMELAEPIHATLTSLESILDPKKFDPKIEKRVFTIAAVDYFSLIIAPKLAQYLSQNAPGIGVNILSASLDVQALLDAGEADFASAPYTDLPDRFDSALLLEDTYVCVIRADHPLAGANPTIEQYAASQHLHVNSKGDSYGFVDDALARQGLSRNIAMTVNGFSVAPAIIDQSDLILTAPRKIIQNYASATNYIFPCPVEAPTSSRRLNLMWHKRLAVHPSHLWFRETVQKISQAL